MGWRHSAKAAAIGITTRTVAFLPQSESALRL